MLWGWVLAWCANADSQKYVEWLFSTEQQLSSFAILVFREKSADADIRSQASLN